MDCPISIVTKLNSNSYIINYDDAFKYINMHSMGSKFAILINAGFTSQGKSTFSEKLSGKKHDIGNKLKFKTIGALITYCGTVQNIIDKFCIKQISTSDKNLHIFNIDTEGINHDKNEPFIEYLFPLIKTCSLVIVFGRTLTDLSIVPLMIDINHLTGANMILTFGDVLYDVDDGIDSISYYLTEAKNSGIGEKIESERIQCEIIPSIDFRDNPKYEFSKIMNNYFISKLLELAALKQFQDSSSFVNELKNNYENQERDLIHAVIGKSNPSDLILESITHECYQMVNQRLENSNQNDIEIYDILIEEINIKFNDMVNKAGIASSASKDCINDIINYIEFQKMTAKFNKNQKEEQQKIIQRNEDKIEKERKLVKFLSIEIAQISSTFALNLISYLKNKDSPSLKCLNTFFVAKCSELVLDSSIYIRKEVLDHIDEDIFKIESSLKENANAAAKLIDEQNEKSEKQKKDCAVKVGGMTIGLLCTFTGHPMLGKAIFGIVGGSSIPFKLNNKADEVNNFVLKIGDKKYEAKYDDLNEIFTNIGADVVSINKTLAENIDESAIKSNTFFEPRDYSAFLEEIIQKESQKNIKEINELNLNYDNDTKNIKTNSKYEFKSNDEIVFVEKTLDGLGNTIISKDPITKNQLENTKNENNRFQFYIFSSVILFIAIITYIIYSHYK